VEKSVVLVHRTFLKKLKENISGVTGETRTVTHNDPVYVDVLDEEGNVIGQKQDGWTYYPVDVPVKRGSYVRIGRTSNGRYTAFIVKSPVMDALRELAQPGQVVELHTFNPDDDDDGSGNEFSILPSLLAIYQRLVNQDIINPQPGDTKLDRLNMVLEWMGFEPIQASTKRQVIRAIFRQLKPGWRQGMDDI